jgi:glycosyltransferase involved in cell wall biosynthesis
MTIYIVDIEAVDTRYTKQWKEYLPQQLQRATGKEVIVISGGDTPQATTPGAFLNFGGTNVYKSKQLEQIGEKFCRGEIKDGDYFLYTDAWNPTVIQLRYMAELLGISIRIGGLWHAGSYDYADFLGRIIGPEPWVRHAEKSMYHVYDQNFFATEFHVKMFFDELLHDGNTFENPWYDEEWEDRYKDGKIVRAGWPMEYLEHSLDSYKCMDKEDLIVFPHRIAPEKQVDIFHDLKEQLPQYEFIVCQDRQLTKNEYHNILGRAKLVFSANLQETLGISWYEGALVNAIPMVPDRLSYSEMALTEFKYPSLWTSDFESYVRNRKNLVNRVVEYMENYESFLPSLIKQTTKLKKEFFSGRTLYEAING